MKLSLKNTLIALSLLTISGVASASSDNLKTADKVEDYTYSTKLDIAHVISSPDLSFCGIRPVEMTYEDHMGNTHVMRYPVFGNGCVNMN